jgi:hypothetical protein
VKWPHAATRISSRQNAFRRNVANLRKIFRLCMHNKGETFGFKSSFPDEISSVTVQDFHRDGFYDGRIKRKHKQINNCYAEPRFWARTSYRIYPGFLDPLTSMLRQSDLYRKPWLQLQQNWKPITKNLANLKLERLHPTQNSRIVLSFVAVVTKAWDDHRCNGLCISLV